MELIEHTEQTGNSNKIWCAMDLVDEYDCLDELEVGRDVAAEDETEKVLSLAYENLEHIPKPLAECLGSQLTSLDLSHNRLRNIDFLCGLPALSTLVLDHNLLTGEVTFPFLPRLRLLWLNHNKVSRLQPLTKSLMINCPQLRHLSLIGNRAAPSPLTNGDPGECARYRLSMVWQLPMLEYLDERAVSRAERARSQYLQLRAIYNSRYRSSPNRGSSIRRSTCV